MPSVNRVALFTNEYPPHVYGGAGVHVEYLSRELSRLVPVEVRCFGEQDVQEPNLRVKGYGAWSEAKKNTDPRFGGALDAMYRSLAMAKDNLDASIVHCAHLVRPVCRLPGQEAVGHPVRADHPLAGAAAPLEGGTARQRLSPELLDREQRHHRRPMP